MNTFYGVHLMENWKLETIHMCISAPLCGLAPISCHQYFFGSGGMAQRANKGTSFRSWAGLPYDLLNMISKRLSLVDYLAFGGVCSSWRSSSVAQRAVVLASQPPLLVLVSVYAKRGCFLFDISDGGTYKAMLPNVHGRSFWGFSCGYLIMRDKKFKISLVNLITRKELDFPTLPELYTGYITPDFRPVLAYSTALSEFVLVVAHRFFPLLHFCRFGDENWTVYGFVDEPWMIVDLAVFYGKIYFLTNRGRIGIFKMSPHPTLTLLTVKGSPNYLSCSLQLVISDGQLFMVDVCNVSRVYKLDQSRTEMEWMKMESLGDKALFLNYTQSAIVNNPSMWGGQSNSIYYTLFNQCYTYSIDDGDRQSFPFIQGNRVGYLRPFFWFFPHLSHDENLLDDM
ncbi:putative F-box protein At4g22180 isoform X1 [Actinidia eriantha]|uniref:putative F-box protein At4g22180 isoform X1 n=1 Tax=Actinidia eriantha TaxID=165200 RepID=UPI00258A3584|nr:putative F-box protein At4g22180 isoform X1 [Actinidia eriantha]XP_057491100.1 putative F-box protein At4g22180 isoform X1 [Actinidia eriantha]XP_057491101.1 putative F-box protein At4g22180 isoform X1 [Actinidia eriantha]